MARGRCVAVGREAEGEVGRWWRSESNEAEVSSASRSRGGYSTWDRSMCAYCSSSDESSCAFRFLLEHVWVVRVVDREPGRVHARVRARSLRLVDEDLSVQRLERGSGELSERGTC